MSEPSRSLEDLLNQSTPYAPASEEEERERLRAMSSRSRSAEPTAPAYVYVPTRPYRPGEDQEIRLELRGIGSDATALAVFTSEDLLTERLGEFQPRARFAVLDLLVQIAPAGIRVVVNPTVAPGTELWTDDTTRAWNEQHPPNARNNGT